MELSLKPGGGVIVAGSTSEGRRVVTSEDKVVRWRLNSMLRACESQTRFTIIVVACAVANASQPSASPSPRQAL